MNGFAQQSPSNNQGDTAMKKAPSAWTEAEMGRARIIVTASERYDKNVVANPLVRYLKAAQAEGRKDIKKFADFSPGEQAALMFLSKQSADNNLKQGFVPLTDAEYFAELKDNPSMQHGLHPEDDGELKKIIDTL